MSYGCLPYVYNYVLKRKKGKRKLDYVVSYNGDRLPVCTERPCNFTMNVFIYILTIMNDEILQKQKAFFQQTFYTKHPKASLCH